jgi:hypothetical protein
MRIDASVERIARDILALMGRAGRTSKRRRLQPVVIGALAALTAGATGLADQPHVLQLAELGIAGILAGGLAARDAMSGNDGSFKKCPTVWQVFLSIANGKRLQVPHLGVLSDVLRMPVLGGPRLNVPRPISRTPLFGNPRSEGCVSPGRPRVAVVG